MSIFILISDSMLAPFWFNFGSFFDHLGVLLGSFGGHLGMHAATFWPGWLQGVFRDRFGRHFGTIWEVFWDPFRLDFGYIWEVIWSYTHIKNRENYIVKNSKQLKLKAKASSQSEQLKLTAKATR